MGWLQRLKDHVVKVNTPNPHAKMFVECSRKSGKSMAQLADWLEAYPKDQQVQVLEAMHADLVKKEELEARLKALPRPEPLDTGQLKASGTFVPLTHRAPKQFVKDGIKVTEGHPSGLTGREVAKHSTLHTTMRHGEKTLTEKAEAARAQTQAARPSATMTIPATDPEIVGVVELAKSALDSLDIEGLAAVADRVMDKTGQENDKPVRGVEKLKGILQVAQQQGHLTKETYAKIVEQIDRQHEELDVDVAEFIGLEEDEFL